MLQIKGEYWQRRLEISKIYDNRWDCVRLINWETVISTRHVCEKGKKNID